MDLRRALAGTLTAAALAGGLGLAAVAPASAAPADCAPQGYGSVADLEAVTLDTEERRLFNAINELRVSNGLRTLRVSTSLARPAMWKSQDGLAQDSLGRAKFEVDSRGMGPAERVSFCSDKPTYHSFAGELSYRGSGGGAPYGDALAFWKRYSDKQVQYGGQVAVLMRPDVRYVSVARAVNPVTGVYVWVSEFGY